VGQAVQAVQIQFLIHLLPRAAVLVVIIQTQQ
jgi:hypothetical protein